MKGDPPFHVTQIAAFPSLGGYHASKWALEGMTESIAQEVAGFGIKVTLVAPGGFDTGWSGASAVVADAQPQYVDAGDIHVSVDHLYEIFRPKSRSHPAEPPRSTVPTGNRIIGSVMHPQVLTILPHQISQVLRKVPIQRCRAVVVSQVRQVRFG